MMTFKRVRLSWALIIIVALGSMPGGTNAAAPQQGVPNRYTNNIMRTDASPTRTIVKDQVLTVEVPVRIWKGPDFMRTARIRTDLRVRVAIYDPADEHCERAPLVVWYSDVLPAKVGTLYEATIVHQQKLPPIGDRRYPVRSGLYVKGEKLDDDSSFGYETRWVSVK